ncbi:VTT domain-containing protein [Leifsonia sp. H3M29-4]|uniref:DedA family protein n=1 Tax=Salinibacterium metalliresistens TaxID=3031321 RepID=UPI0023DA3527|nr:VTT domain-containing protein [Salinibacterium metalliresistens]MDF1479589.1 VTT domain-containing protein [Salinibacterium metalliresistens]
MALIPWLDPETIIQGAGPWALLVVCFIVFAETGLLVGFLLPGDTLLVITGLLAFYPGIGFDVWWVALAIGLSAFLGGEVGYLIGHKAGPRIFERKETGLFSIENVKRTNKFFERFGGLAVILARFVPIVRTFAPVAAGVGHMDYRKYTLYNLIGAVIWGVGLTFLGYLLGYVPILGDFVREYIDIILIGAVLITVIPTAFHYWQSTRKAKKRAADAKILTDAEAEALALHPKDFDQKLGD